MSVGQIRAARRKNIQRYRSGNKRSVAAAIEAEKRKADRAKRISGAK